MRLLSNVHFSYSWLSHIFLFPLYVPNQVLLKKAALCCVSFCPQPLIWTKEEYSCIYLKQVLCECCKINTMKNNQRDSSLGVKRGDLIKGVKQSPLNEKRFEVELII